MELREKVGRLIRDGVWAKDENGNCHTRIVGESVVADAILDIPEIKEALALREQWLDSPSGPPLTTPEEVDAWFKSVRNA